MKDPPRMPSRFSQPRPGSRHAQDLSEGGTRLSSPGDGSSGISVGTIVLALCGLVLVVVVSAGLIVHHAADVPANGPNPTPFWPADGTAALLDGAAALVAGQPPDADAAAAMARQAILQSPLNPMALKVLGDAEAAKGNNAEATRLLRLAAERGTHLPALQIWAINDAAKSTDYDRLIQRIDLYLRKTADNYLPDFVLGPTPTEVIATLVGISGDPKAAPAIRSVIDAAPHWRGFYLDQLAKEGQLGAFETIAADIDVGDIAPQWRLYLNRLIDNDRALDAYALWYQFMDHGQELYETGNYLFDGGFERADDDNMPFGWTIFPAPSTDIVYDHAVRSGGSSSLRITFASSTPFWNVLQSLILSPGNFTLSGSVKTLSLRAARGLQWRLYCGRTTFTKIGESPLFSSGTADWTTFSIPFTVPPEKCDNQLLRLEVPARIPAERAVNGTIWFDDLSIERRLDQ
ncbi:carbohydrate binding domain-containing protein [Xanthobacter wiegelii]|uniref:hypothetical protein n=1 Tax=Xanthobacter wiegelii TaxID=3119913 RepID=UPI0037267032